MIAAGEELGLILIDVQKGFKDPFWGKRNNPDLEERIARLLGFWRKVKQPIYHVQHQSLVPDIPLSRGTPGTEFMDCARPRPGEPVIQKHVNSCFIGTDLENRLRIKRLKGLVMAGLTTDHCVSTSVRMAGNMGFKVYCIGDATATFDRIGLDGKVHRAEDVHAIHLTSIHQEFATVLDTEAIIKHFPQA